MKKKKKLSTTEEFQIMKLVLDKFLWISAIIMLFGIYTVIEKGDLVSSIYYFIAAIVILLLFMVLIIKEYEISK